MKNLGVNNWCMFLQHCGVWCEPRLQTPADKLKPPCPATSLTMDLVDASDSTTFASLTVEPNYRHNHPPLRALTMGAEKHPQARYTILHM